uniref:Uncharacterized protein n=1 Tax=Glossina pallidipes TaxID=7398 RepID=A0A1A9Z9Q9_GLOPL
MKERTITPFRTLPVHLAGMRLHLLFIACHEAIALAFILSTKSSATRTYLHPYRQFILITCLRLASSTSSCKRLVSSSLALTSSCIRCTSICLAMISSSSFAFSAASIFLASSRRCSIVEKGIDPVCVRVTDEKLNLFATELSKIKNNKTNYNDVNNDN